MQFTVNYSMLQFYNFYLTISYWVYQVKISLFNQNFINMSLSDFELCLIISVWGTMRFNFSLLVFTIKICCLGLACFYTLAYT